VSTIIGIDPGLKGGIAIFENDKLLKVYKMPTLTKTTAFKHTKGKSKGQYRDQESIDTLALVNILSAYDDPHVWLEKSIPLYGISLQNNLKIAYGAGQLHGVITALGVPFREIMPKAWQEITWINEDIVVRENPNKRIKQSDTDTKATSLNSAERIFPGFNFILKGCKVPHDGCIDAALIANYGRAQG